MRKHLYLIVDHPNEVQIGRVKTVDTRFEMAKKNEERPIQKRNLETGETFTVRLVSLGYHDFEDEEDYQENALDVIREKFGEIDAEHLEKAGLNPEKEVA